MMSNIQLFNQRWNEVYQLIAFKKYEITQQFGVQEKYQIRYDHQYTYVRNILIQNKRPSEWISLSLKTKSILFSFDESKFSFNKINAQEIIAFVNLQNKYFIFQRAPQNHNNQKIHKIIINASPICRNHSLFVPFIDQNQPQYLNSKSISAAITLKELLPNFSLAYNSQGAASSVNHLHFHIINFFEIIKKQISFNILNSWEKYQNYHLRGLQLTTKLLWGALYIKIYISFGHIYSPSQIDNIILTIEEIITIGLRLKIPYNLIILNDKTFIIVFRGFATPQIPFGFLQFAGVFFDKKQKQSQQLDAANIAKKFQEIALSNIVIEQIQRQLKKIFN